MPANNFQTILPQKKSERMPQFKGHVGVSCCDACDLGILVHETAFFRDFETKKFVQWYINENFSNIKDIKIVVGGCSTGEEVITLSMILNSIKDKVSILGIDLSKKVIERAKSKRYVLQLPDLPENLIDDYAAFKDSFLGFDVNKSLTPIQAKQKKVFEDFFEPVLFKNCNLSFWQKLKIKISQTIAELSLPVKKSKPYSLKSNMAENCEFEVGDIKDINKITNDKKSHVIFFSNSLYHLTTIYDEYERYMRPDFEKVMTNLFKEFKKNLHKNGIVCFGEEEQSQIPKFEAVPKIMQKLGFEALNQTPQHCANVYRKLD